MAQLFSQIPVQVLHKAGLTTSREERHSEKRRIRFYEDHEVRPKLIQDETHNEPTSSYSEPLKEKIESSDAITQTDSKRFHNQETQTEESLYTRPLTSTDNDIHRLNMQSYAPITPIPRCRPGSEPPLRIGLTLRGKKRKVFYPDDSENFE